MATFVKPAAVSGLNAAHALHADIVQFFEFGVLDKELVSDIELTIAGAAVVSDPDIGPSREFIAGATVAESLNIPQDCTVLLVTAGRGARTVGGAAVCDANFLWLSTSGNKIGLRYGYASGGRFEARYDGASGATKDLNSDAMGSDGAFDTGHAFAVHYADTETRKTCLNGTIGAATDAVAGGALGSPPVSVPMFVTNGTVIIGSGANFPVGALVVFDRLLTDAELQDITSDPWAMLDSGPAVGTLTGVQGSDIIANGEQNITGSASSIPDGNVPIGARIGSTVGVGGTYLTGFAYTTTANAGAFNWEADVPSGITLSTNMEVSVDYAPL